MRYLLNTIRNTKYNKKIAEAENEAKRQEEEALATEIAMKLFADEEMKRELLVNKLACMWRGKMARRRVWRLKCEKAAVVIQCAFRSQQVYTAYEVLLTIVCEDYS